MDDNLPAIPGDLAGVDAKIADYERQMADTHGWFHNEPGQRDVAQLYEAQERLRAGLLPAVAPDDRDMPADEAGDMAAPTVVRQAYGEAALGGLSDHDIGYVQDQMAGFLQLLPDPMSFSASFDAADMTDTMRNSLFRVAALPVLPEEERLDPDDLLDKRVRQIREGLSPADIESGEAWLKLIPEAERNLLLEWIITPYDQRALIPRLT